MEILKFDGSGDGRCSGMKRTGQVVALLDGNVRICVHRCREGRRPETAKHCKNLPELLLRYFHLKLILQFLSTSISLSSSSRKIAETFWDREVIYRGRWDSELVDGIGPNRYVAWAVPLFAPKLPERRLCHALIAGLQISDERRRFIGSRIWKGEGVGDKCVKNLKIQQYSRQGRGIIGRMVSLLETWRTVGRQSICL